MVYNRLQFGDKGISQKGIHLDTGRVPSVDLLRGIVMIIMALDHVRAYFHFDSFLFSPTDLEKTTPAIFATRFITHLCAPSFIFLAGTSAYFIARKKTPVQTSAFLITRGLWLVLLQVTLIQFGWNFDPEFHYRSSNIISTIGFCMILMAFVIHLPFKAILLVGFVMVAGHNLLDDVSFESGSLNDVVWSFLHQRKLYTLGNNYSFLFLYPIIPWIGVMALGYCLGRIYDQNYSMGKRREILLLLGFTCLNMFFILRGGINKYGDPTPWTYHDDGILTFLSLLNVEKYPPSLLFLCLMLGIALVMLSLLEGRKLDRWKPATVFGKVALFYYVVHIYVIHLLALITATVLGYPWQTMIFPGPHSQAHALMKGTYGFGLPVVYMVWISVVCLLYPLCVWWNSLKARNSRKWWVSYV